VNVALSTGLDGQVLSFETTIATTAKIVAKHWRVGAVRTSHHSNILVRKMIRMIKRWKSLLGYRLTVDAG